MADQIENITNSDSGVNNGADTSQYIDALKKMKETSVSRDAYDKLMADNKALLDAMINGRDIELPAKEEPEVDVKKLREEYLATDGSESNIDFFKKLMTLRNETIKEYGQDPIFAKGHKYTSSANEMQEISEAYNIISDCLEQSDGDNDTFMRLLNRRF